MTRIDRLAEACAWTALGAPLGTLALALNLAARRDPLLARALAQRDCVYRLQSRDGARAWHLIIHHGRVRTAPRAPCAPVATLTVLRLGALATLRPEGLLSAMIDNDLVQSGGTYDLYRLGFIFDLMRRRATGGEARPRV